MTPDLVISGHNFSDQGRVQIRQAQEEIFRLKTEDSRLRLEMKAKEEDVEAYRQEENLRFNWLNVISCLISSHLWLSAQKAGQSAGWMDQNRR